MGHDEPIRRGSAYPSSSHPLDGRNGQVAELRNMEDLGDPPTTADGDDDGRRGGRRRRTKYRDRQSRDVIVVATADFEVYHDVLTALQERGVVFTTVEPGDPLPAETTVVITGPEDDLGGEESVAGDNAEAAIPEDLHVVRAEPDGPRQAVEAVLAHLRGDGGRTVVGIDPGERPGIAVMAGETVVAVFQVPADQVGAVVAEEVEGAVDPLVRIGDGARVTGSHIVDDLPDVPVELVDETGTTPYLGAGARGMGDVLAAVNIARIPGERIESRDVTPTAGELQRIKDRSREVSETNRAIDESLARAVAAGELSIEEALAAHRGAEAGEDGA